MKQNDIAKNFLSGGDIGQRAESVLAEVAERLSFTVDNDLVTSRWWNSATAGAFHVRGTFQGKPAFLKVQGIRPATSEAVMIGEFEKLARPGGVRPPQLYANLEWDEARQYEALVLEDVGDNTLVADPATEAQVKEYFEVYRKYRAIIPEYPWIERPAATTAAKIAESMATWKQIRAKLVSDYPLIQPEDAGVIDEAIRILLVEYGHIPLTFQHGHLSARDIYRVDRGYVLTSNLYWSWRPPLYDLVFAWHWRRLWLVAEIGRAAVVQEQTWWERGMQKCVGPGEYRLYCLARLERAAAALNLDALTLDSARPDTGWILDEIRREIRTMINTLNDNS